MHRQLHSQAYQPRREARHETLRVRGLDMHLTRWGPPPEAAKPPLVLLHGWLDAGGSFQFLVDALPADWPIVAMDWRGFGLSQWAVEGYSFADYLADLDEFLDRVAPAVPARLVGHSLGGNVVSVYAGLRPERVRCLVNLEGFGLRRSSPQQATARILKWLDQIKRPPAARGYNSIEQLVSLLRFRYPRFSPEAAEFVARVWAVADGDGRVRLSADPRHHWMNPLVYRREDAEGAWERIRAPMLMLIGEHSEYPKRLGDDGTLEGLRRTFPGVEVATVAGAGHMVHIEKAKEVAALIEIFLDANR